MLTLNDGRAELWQWDTGRTLAVDADCSQVHFSNKVFGRSIDVDVVGGAAIIPDILLQTDKDLNVWAFVGTAENGYTKISKTFKVNRRNKPADYVFTPVEQTTLAELSGRIDRIEESQDPDAIKNAVADYISKNPITVEETDPTVPAWAKEAQKPSYTASEVGADPSGTAAEQVAAHNSGANTHGDIRVLIQGLTDRLNALADSDDTTLDQLSEVVAYIKNNRSLIEAITTSKVSVSDIVDNLTTNVSNKPLSAAQGVALKALIDAISVPDKLPNPNALTFSGAVTGSYDGSAPLEVEIPSGGGTGNEKDIDFTIEIQENTGRIDFEVDDKNEPLNLTECFILIHYIAGGTNTANINGEITFNRLGPIVLNTLGVMPGQNYGRPWMLHIKKMFNTIFINAACMNTTRDITSIGVKGANFAYTYGLLFTESEKINKISIILYGNAAFAPGSKIRIIGR